jgi:hypothetical protein
MRISSQQAFLSIDEFQGFCQLMPQFFQLSTEKGVISSEPVAIFQHSQTFFGPVCIGIDDAGYLSLVVLHAITLKTVAGLFIWATWGRWHDLSRQAVLLFSASAPRR